MQKRGLVEMIGATFIWGSTPLMGIFSALPSGVFVFFRVLFAFPFIFYFALKHTTFKEFFNLKPFFSLFFSGIMLGVNWVFFFWALNITDVATVVTIYYVGPIISMILAIIFLDEKLNKFILISIFLAFIGVFISSGGINLNKGAIIAFLAAVSYGFLGFFSKLATINHRAESVTAWQLLISIFITFPFLFLYEWNLNFDSFIIVLIAGIIHTALALFLWYDSLNYIKVSLSSILQYLDIVFAMILAYIFLNQIPNLYQIIGACFIIFAGVLSSIKEFNIKKQQQ